MGKRRSQHHSQIVRVPSSSRGRAARHDEVIVSGDLSPGRPSSISAYSRPAYPLGQSCRPLTRFPVLARCVAGLAQSTVSLPAYRWLIRCCSLGGPPKDHNASREGVARQNPRHLILLGDRRFRELGLHEPDSIRAIVTHQLPILRPLAPEPSGQRYRPALAVGASRPLALGGRSGRA